MGDDDLELLMPWVRDEILKDRARIRELEAENANLRGVLKSLTDEAINRGLIIWVYESSDNTPDVVTTRIATGGSRPWMGFSSEHYHIPIQYADTEQEAMDKVRALLKSERERDQTDE